MSTEKPLRARPPVPWRTLGWGCAVILLALPFIAMRLQVEGVNWTASDFVFAALIFGVVGLLIELAVRASANTYYRAGVIVVVLAGLLLVWSNLAVGILGDEPNPANLMFFVVPLLAAGGSALARFRPRGMAWAMVAAALWLLVVPVVAYVFGIGQAAAVTRFDYPVPLLLFAGMWFGAAGLLARAARAQPSS